LVIPAVLDTHKYGEHGRKCMVCVRFVNARCKMPTAIQMKNQVFTDTMPCKLMVTDVSEEAVAFTFI
jgi:hypothetical protein